MTIIKHKRGTGIPAVTELEVGELAIDTLAAKLYTKIGNAVVELGGGSSEGGSPVHIGDTAPSDPAEGDLWYDTSSDTLFLFDGFYWFSTESCGAGGGLEEAPEDGIQYARKDAAWEPVSAVHVGDDEPANPVTGQLWYKPTDNEMYVYGGSDWQAFGSGSDGGNGGDGAPSGLWMGSEAEYYDQVNDPNTIYFITPIDWDMLPFTNSDHGQDMASGNGVIVAISDNTGSPYYTRAATSTDGGKTWGGAVNINTQSPPITGATSIAFNGSIFCMVCNGAGKCATSPDGKTWTKQAGMPMNATAIVWANNQFVTVGSSNRCCTSPDGVNWTENNGIKDAFGNTTGRMTGLAWNGEVYCAVGRDQCATSPDGVNWTAQPALLSLDTSSDTYKNRWEEVHWFDNQFVAICPATAVGSVPIATSPDGVSWTAGLSGSDISGFLNNRNPKSLAYDGKHYLLMSDTAGNSALSLDLIKWHPVEDFPEPAGGTKAKALEGSFFVMGRPVSNKATYARGHTLNVFYADEINALLRNRIKDSRGPVTQDTKDFNDEELGDE